MAIPTDFIAFYTMDNISGASLIDESANGHHGVIVGAIPAPGYIDNALQFDGSNDHVELPVTIANANSTMTVCFWFNHTAAAFQAFFSARSGANNGVKQLISFNNITAGDIRLTGATASTFVALGTHNGSYNDGADHFVVSTIDNTTGDYEVLVDDVVVISGTNVSLVNPTVDKVYVGMNYGTQHYNGKTDQFRIYARFLSTQEKTDLYADVGTRYGFSGSIVESLGVTNWFARAHRLNDGVLAGEVEVTNGSYTLDNLDGTPFTVACVPDQGSVWSSDDPVIVNQLLFPPDPQTTPYYYKVTVAGTTGSSEPTWSTTSGTTFSDGTATLECVERLVQPQIHSPVIPVEVV